MGIISLLLIIALIPATIAAAKGRNFFTWYLYGFVFWIVALIHAIVLKGRAQQAREALLARTGPSTGAELERFAKLHKEGVITDADFTERKRALLSAPS
jgi:uncharacterized membrane protein